MPSSDHSNVLDRSTHWPWVGWYDKGGWSWYLCLLHGQQHSVLDFLLTTHWDDTPVCYRYALRSPNFKTALINFFMKEWKDNKYASFLTHKTVVVSHEKQCVQYRGAVSGNVEHNDASEYVCSHVVCHLSMLSKAKSGHNAVVRATDTYIMIILLYHSIQLEANVWMDLTHSSDNTRRHVHTFN